MSTRPWKIRSAIRAVADMHGVDVHFEQTRTHMRCMLCLETTSRVVHFSVSPSDVNAIRAILRDVRRAIYSMDDYLATMKAAGSAHATRPKSVAIVHGSATTRPIIQRSGVRTGIVGGRRVTYPIVARRA